MKCIYLRTNTVNGMQYVGQTNNIEQRNRQWKCLKWGYANPIISQDREKYGLDKWNFEILKECDDSEGDYWETHYIQELKTTYPNGYNMSEFSTNLGLKHTEEAKKKMSEALKGKIPWIKGKHHTEEAKQKNKDKHLCKTVYQYTLDGELVREWESTAECGRNGFHQGHVAECCNGKIKKAYGYKWSYTKKEDIN